MKSELSKKGTLQSRIDQKGVTLLMSSLPIEKKFRMLFKEETNDYGIDGEFQFFINENNTGEFYKVQIKSKKEGRYIENGRYLSMPLDRSSIHYLIDSVTQPVALIVVDTRAKKVFWHPIQLDNDLRQNFEQRLSDITITSESTINVRVDVTNKLSKKNYQGLYNYFKNSKEKISMRNLLDIKTDKTLSEGFKLFKDGLDQTLQLEGFDHIYRKGDLISNGTMFSMTDHTGLIIDFVPNSKYKEELVPLIQLKTKFSTKTELDKYNKFKQLVTTGEGSVDLEKENIDLFQFKTGDQIIDNDSLHDNLKLTISSPIMKKRSSLSIYNGKDFFNLRVDTWVESDEIIFESVDEEVLHIKMSFGRTNTQGKFKILIRTEKVTSIDIELRIWEFVHLLKEKFEVHFIAPDGFMRKIFEAVLNEEIPFINERLSLLRALDEIHSITGIDIIYPIPKDIDMEDIRNIFWLHRLIKQGSIIEKLTVNFTLDNKQKRFVQGDWIQLNFSPPNLYLFKNTFLMQDYEQIIRGQISKILRKKNGNYKIIIDSAENILKKH